VRLLILLTFLALLPQAIDAPRISQKDFKKLIAAHNVLIVDTQSGPESSAGPGTASGT